MDRGLFYCMSASAFAACRFRGRNDAGDNRERVNPWLPICPVNGRIWKARRILPGSAELRRLNELIDAKSRRVCEGPRGEAERTTWRNAVCTSVATSGRLGKCNCAYQGVLLDDRLHCIAWRYAVRCWHNARRGAWCRELSERMYQVRRAAQGDVMSQSYEVCSSLF